MKNVTPNGFSDELIAQYLLGELAENEQIAIEDEAFSDPEVKERIAAIEQDLIDEYVRILSCGYVRKPYSCRGLSLTHSLMRIIPRLIGEFRSQTLDFPSKTCTF